MTEANHKTELSDKEQKAVLEIAKEIEKSAKISKKSNIATTVAIIRVAKILLRYGVHSSRWTSVTKIAGSMLVQQIFFRKLNNKEVNNNGK